MKQCLEICIKKIYPKNWDKYSEREKQKKEQEFNIVSFLLNAPIGKTQFEGTKTLFVEFCEGPDFLVYSEDRLSDKIGLEITKCYANDRCSSPAINSDLEKICKEVFRDIQHTGDINLSHINYANIIFAHEVMVGNRYDKKVLKSELKKVLLNNKVPAGEFVKRAKTGYSPAYAKNDLKITIFSEMMYIVPGMTNFDGEHDPVLDRIKEKQDKLVCYKRKNDDSVNNWWLCLEIPQDAHFDPSLYKLPSDYKSGYDKIYLLSLSFYGYGTYLVFSK